MRDLEPIQTNGAARGPASPAPHSHPSRRTLAQCISFNRAELNQILSLYGRMVAAGDWRDYAIGTSKDKAIFSVFRRSSEHPLYRIVKDPRLARRQGAYSVVAATGLILKRGHDLARVLSVLDRRLKLVET